MNLFDNLPADLEQYITEYTQPEPPLLAELNRETWAKVLMPRMIAGHVQGRILSTLSRMIRPRRVLEIGTYTGYSALCLAEGLPPDGLIHTLDINDELSNLSQKFFKKAGIEQQIHLHNGNAMEIIPTLNETWDMVFIDADKENYSAYLDLIFPRVRMGGWILADNVLWEGKVYDPKARDKDTQGIRTFNEKALRDKRLKACMLPVRDGILVLEKIAE